MKVNPLGIQSYQSPNSARAQAEQKSVIKSGAEDKIVLTPQPENKQSALAVKATPTDYSSLLTEPERRAMEALFAKFKESGKTLGGSNTSSDAERGVGQIIDIKV